MLRSSTIRPLLVGLLAAAPAQPAEARVGDRLEHESAVRRCLSAQGAAECMRACHDALDFSRLDGELDVSDSEAIATKLASCSSDFELFPSLGRYGDRSADSLHKIFDARHSEAAAQLIDLARYKLARGELSAAVALLRNAIRFHDTEMRAALSEGDLVNMLAHFSRAQDLAISLMLADDGGYDAPALALTITLLQKGRLLDAAAAFSRAMHGEPQDRRLRPLISSWRQARQKRYKLLFGGSGALPAAEHKRQLDQLQAQIEQLEHQISGQLPILPAHQPPGFDAIVSQIADKLPSDSALIEIVRANLFRPQPIGAPSLPGQVRYVAMILTSEKQVIPADLGDATDIDRDVTNLLWALQSPGADPLLAAQAVYRRVMKPLQQKLQGISRIYLSTDGTLNLVPFDALHDDQDYLVGRYHFLYLTSGRDLLRARSGRTPQAPLLIANPDFGQPEPRTAENANVPLNLYQRLAGLPPLPGTLREAQQLAPLLGVSAQLDKDASERAVWAARAPWILHIATHGLLLHELDPSAPISSRAEAPARAPESGKRSKNVAVDTPEWMGGDFDVMHRSALTLAGVLQGHRAATTQDDGLLTAEEARMLDLDGTQLVVLSACQTGQGSLRTGQGVYGLRRAFLAAGTETLVSSLWRVSDDATGELMELYYKKLLDKQHPEGRLEAMTDAMQELRKRTGRAHPYYWAPFLVIGQGGLLGQRASP